MIMSGYQVGLLGKVLKLPSMKLYKIKAMSGGLHDV